MAARNPRSAQPSNGSRSKARGRKRHQEPKTPIERFISLLTSMLLTKQMPQRELAERLGVTIGTLTKYLRGEVFPNNVKTHITQKLARLRGVSLDSLLHYFETGHFDEGEPKTTFEDVVAWVGSDAGQEDLIAVLEQATAAQKRMLSLHIEESVLLQKAARWSDKGSLAYGQALREIYTLVAEEKELSQWDAWAEIRSTPCFEEKSIEYIKCAQEIFSGSKELSGEMLTEAMNEYGDCPARLALEQWAQREFPELRKLGLDAIES